MNEDRRERVTAFIKVERVIDSCITEDHVKSTVNMIENFEKVFSKFYGYSEIALILWTKLNDKQNSLYFINNP